MTNKRHQNEKLNFCTRSTSPFRLFIAIVAWSIANPLCIISKLTPATGDQFQRLTTTAFRFHPVKLSHHDH